MATDLIKYGVMIAGGFLGVGLIRRRRLAPAIFNDLTYHEAIVNLPEAGLGVGKDNLPNTAYMLPAAIAVGAYFYL